jgi:signal transduction histidine kinase
MVQRQPVVVDDVAVDSRVNASVVGTTFVRSLVSVPVRPANPVAAIGTYWALPREREATDVRLLQALADAAADAMARLDRIRHLEDAVRERSQELESLSYAISHDLRAPIRHLEGFTSILLLDAADLSEPTQHNVRRIQDAGTQLREMVNGLLTLSRASRAEVHGQRVDVAELARQIAGTLNIAPPSAGGRAGAVEFVSPASLPVTADPRLIQTVIRHLLENAWKFTGPTPGARVELGLQPAQDGRPAAYFVRDNGVGFETASAGRLFGVFQRLHRPEEFPGLGIGLAMTKRIIAKHGGTVWATGTPDAGATIFFTLPGKSTS